MARQLCFNLVLGLLSDERENGFQLQGYFHAEFSVQQSTSHGLSSWALHSRRTPSQSEIRLDKITIITLD